MKTNKIITLDPEAHNTAHVPLSLDKQSKAEKYAVFLSSFRGHSLQTQSSLALMDRVDKKYVLSKQLLSELLSALQTDYSLLEIGRDRIFTYENTYFDTQDRVFYRSHHNGKLNRHKVRYRRYAETGTSYLEVKFKSNKQRTIKERIPIEGHDQTHTAIDRFIFSMLSEKYTALQPSLLVNYLRITFLNQATNERLTIDLDLCFSQVGSCMTKTLPGLFIAELKSSGKIKNSPFLEFANSRRIAPSGFSKYCVGCCLTDGRQLKTNRFKPLLRRIAALNGSELERKFDLPGTQMQPLDETLKITVT